jgi:superfamily II DNA or RNA helicase
VVPKKPILRAWQHAALSEWQRSGHRGIISVVTGGGKTLFALACIDTLRPDTAVIVVPTLALLDQWWEETANYFGLALDEVNIITGGRHVREGTINLVVLNTAAKISQIKRRGCFLIVDECHKAASEQYRAVLSIPNIASLGLSATPERPYDDWLNEVVVPALGPIIYTYSYKDALRDRVIVPFELRNVVFELEPERQKEYDKLTKTIARYINRCGADAPETVALFLRRARLMNLSLNRVRIALKLAASHRGEKTLIFHEDIEACDLIFSVLHENGVRAGIYHSKLTLRQRAEILAAYRRGDIDVLVTCRAPDKSFNVPETEVGIIAASTATRRQRIQRLGRVLRPSGGKTAATVYTLVATPPEIGRLKDEEEQLEGVAHVSWSHA